jgi:hypothetical protein
MGYLYKPAGITTFPYEFAKNLVNAYNYTVFIETGTCNGDNAIRCKQFFETVYTIEASQECYEFTLAKHGTSSGVHFEFGDSRTVLSNICIAESGKKKIFWLDAHYSGGNTFKNDSPLLEEINIINQYAKENSIILVDDARYIHSEYAGTRYAEYTNLIPLLASDIHRYIVCIADAFIAVPYTLKNELDIYCQNCLQEEQLWVSPVPKMVKIKRVIKNILSMLKIRVK